MIELRSVSFRYRLDWVLKEISFQIEKGECIGLIGPNGSGKSTLLKTLCRFLSPQRGEILLNAHSLKEMSQRDIAKKIAVVPQEAYSLFPFRVIEIVLMGRSPHLGHLMFERSEDLDIVRKAMEWTEILPMADRYIDELSGGERKRVFIARALAQEPEIILLDEPTANLDIHHQVDFLNLILSLNQDKGLTIVMASHDLNIASEYCDRLVLLREGRIFKMGLPRDVITQETIEEVYGCKVWVDENPLSGMPRVSLIQERKRRQ